MKLDEKAMGQYNLWSFISNSDCDMCKLRIRALKAKTIFTTTTPYTVVVKFNSKMQQNNRLSP